MSEPAPAARWRDPTRWAIMHEEPSGGSCTWRRNVNARKGHRQAGEHRCAARASSPRTTPAIRGAHGNTRQGLAHGDGHCGHHRSSEPASAPADTAALHSRRGGDGATMPTDPTSDPLPRKGRWGL